MDRGERGIWQGMIRRCTPGLPGSEYWGDKGVTVCEKWAASFEAFIEDVGPRPSLDHSIDRYPDPYGNYEPGNTRWATPQQQRENQRARIPGLRLEAKKQVFSALWNWMLRTGFRDTSLAWAISERTARAVSPRQVARWRKGFGFPSRIEHIRAIDELSKGEVTFKHMLDDKARADAKASAQSDLDKLPAERAFA